jgi:hypothetical protein
MTITASAGVSIGLAAVTFSVLFFLMRRYRGRFVNSVKSGPEDPSTVPSQATLLSISCSTDEAW